MKLKALLTFLYLLSFLHLQATEEGQKPLKTLVLIIASNSDAYNAFEESWRSYMHLDPEHFECYFIRGDETIEQDTIIAGDTIYSKTKECLIPGVLNKTFMSFEALESRLDEFDFVLRANLSSFFVWPRLQEFLKNLPKKNVYCGIAHYFLYYPLTFVNGSGIIFSTDLVRKMLAHRNELVDINIIDDVAMGEFFKRQQVQITHSGAIEILSEQAWNELKYNIPPNLFHFRIKALEDSTRAADLRIHKDLFDIFYSEGA